MRVCFVSPTGAAGGGEKSMIDLIDALLRRGVECRGIVPRHDYVAQQMAQRQVPFGVVKYHPWVGPDIQPLHGVRRAGKILLRIGRAARVAQVARKWRCDVMVTNTLDIMEGAVAAAMLRTPHITHVREFGDLDHGWGFELGARRQMSILARLSRLCVLNSHAVAAHHAATVPAAKRRVIYNACLVPERYAQARAALPDRAGPLWCVITGHVSASKGQDQAVAALARVRQTGRDVRLRVIGGGPALPALRRRVAELGLEAWVDLTGYLQEPYEMMRTAEVALMCSRCEAFGRVAIEAMKLGLPVIGSASGGTVEQIRDGFNGWLYRPDDVADLADKIAHLADHRDTVIAMGAQAQRWAWQTFNLDRYGEQMLAVLHECVRAKPGQQPQLDSHSQRDAAATRAESAADKRE